MTAGERPVGEGTCKTCPYGHMCDLPQFATRRVGFWGDWATVETGTKAAVWCHRYPQETLKDPGDWCGEHPDRRANTEPQNECERLGYHVCGPQAGGT